MRSRAIADDIAKNGIMPLEVLVICMREAWEIGDKPAAIAIAKDAAPYLHPKLAPVDAKTGETAKFVIVNPCN